MKSILVTGGAGFIGSHTCLSLVEKGYKVVVIDSLINSSKDALDKLGEILIKKNISIDNKISFLKGDTRDKEFLENIFISNKEKNSPISCVIHFAGLKAVNESVIMPLKYWDINVNGTINLLQTMLKNGCRTIVFSSSATIYGISENTILNEKNDRNPTNPYGSTKLVVEMLLSDLFHSKSNEWKIINLRYFNPIGAHPSGLIGESPRGVPTNIFPSINFAASGKIKELKVFGNNWPTPDGTCIRDYIHVMDIAEGHIAALEYLEKNEPQIKYFNLGTGLGTSVLELIKVFQKVNRVHVPFSFYPRRKGDLSKVIADNSLAIKYLNWSPKRNLEEMCRDGWIWAQKSNSLL
tara:strand:- start:117 stop:1169 length:1053 start_codon:yes stop_codon:yes gene_type:complete